MSVKRHAIKALMAHMSAPEVTLLTGLYDYKFILSGSGSLALKGKSPCP